MAARRSKKPQPGEAPPEATEEDAQPLPSLDDVLAAAREVVILGRKVDLKPIPDLADRLTLLNLDQSVGVRAKVRAAALGLSWRWLRARVPYEEDLVAYGKSVLNAVAREAMTRGESPERAHEDVVFAGTGALILARQDLVFVEGAEAFSELPGDPAGPKSGSASGTDRP